MGSRRVQKLRRRRRGKPRGKSHLGHEAFEKSLGQSCEKYPFVSQINESVLEVTDCRHQYIINCGRD